MLDICCPSAPAVTSQIIEHCSWLARLCREAERHPVVHTASVVEDLVGWELFLEEHVDRCGRLRTLRSVAEEDHAVVYIELLAVVDDGSVRHMDSAGQRRDLEVVDAHVDQGDAFGSELR